MDNIYSRNELIWGKKFQKSLLKKHVIIFGLGGVGSYAAEALARSGVGKLTIVDFDIVSKTNINRQLLALNSTVGKKKTDVMKGRILDINPDINVEIVDDFYTEKLNCKLLLKNKPDFVIDAIDTLSYKIELIKTCIENSIEIISSMGAGNRLDPTKLYISDISEIKPTKCVFINNVIHKLEKECITSGLAVVTSYEKPQRLEKIKEIETITTNSNEEINLTKHTPASVPFVPPVSGYFMASYVIKKFMENQVK